MNDLLQIKDADGRNHYLAPEHVADIVEETDGTCFVYLGGTGGVRFELPRSVLVKDFAEYVNVLRRLEK